VEPDAAAELFPPVWEALMGGRPGVFRRSPDWWQLRTLRRPDEQAANPKRFAALELGGSVQAFAVYRQHPAWDEGSTAARLEVLEAVGASPQATAEIWRYLLDIDWYATLEAQLLPPDHPLFSLRASPRRLRFRLGDSLWVRRVDVGAALSGRAYAGSDEVVIEVRDAVCPWNEGRWRVAPEGAVRVEVEAELALDVSALGAAYLGSVSFAQLRSGLRVEERAAGALERADALFGWRPLPWCPEIF
jgi:predicted acetyltransferase